jgi:hypothetical protein
MSWRDEGWQQAARDYQVGRKHGRHQRITQMDFEPQTPEAQVIRLGNQRDQQQDEARPPAFSDDALALRFIDQHKDSLRYVPSLGKWLRWDGKRWCFDDRLIAYDRMRKVCRAASAECNQPKLAKLVASNKTAAAAERFARSDQRIIATVDELDSDPWLLNTPRATVDLRTGEERSHNQGDLLTKITGRRMHRVGRWFGMPSSRVSLTTKPNYQRISSGWPGIHSPDRHKSTPSSSSTGLAQTARRLSLTPLRPVLATTIARPLSKHSRRHR